MRYHFFKTLYGRFLTAIILVGIIPFLSVGLLIINIETRALNQQSTRELTSLARGLAGELNTYLQDLLTDSQAIAALPPIISMDPAQQGPLLKDLFNHYGKYGQIGISNLDGQLLLLVPPKELVTIAHVPSFQEATRGRQDWVIAPGLFNDTLILHIHTPIYDQNRNLRAVLGSPVPLGTPANILAAMDIGGEGQAFVLDEMGKVLLHPDPAIREARRDYSQWIHPSPGTIPGHVGTARYEIDGQIRIAGYTTIPNFNWTVVVDRPEAEVLAPAVATRNLALTGLLLSILLSAAAAVLLGRSLTRPVQNLAAAAQALGAGNPTAPLPQHADPNTEIGTLVATFSKMRQAVSDREEGLRRSEARNNGLLNAIPDLLFRVRKDGNVIDIKVPAAFAPQFQSNPLRKTNFYQIVYSLGPHPLAQRFIDGFEEALQTGMVQGVESQLDINGRLTDFEARYVTTDDDEMLIMLRDITERNQAEAAIRKHLSALEAANDGMAILDRNLTYTYANDAHAKIHGYAQAQELIGKPWRISYTTQEFNRLNKDVFPVVMEKGAWRGETIGKRHDNSTYFAEMSLTLIETGEYVCVIRDITQRKQSEEALRQAQKLESLGVLAGGIAHDFNNLLTGMLGHASIVQATLPADSDASEQLERLMQSAETAADLTRQLLAYAGKGQFAIQPLNLNRLIRENLGLIETAIPRRAELILNLEEDLPLFEGDRGQIQQVIMNLVINAAESLGQQGGEVYVSTALQTLNPLTPREFIGGDRLAPGNYITLEVRDNGKGMSEATLNHIFDPFFTTKASGHGLGLSATLGIIRTHSGGVQVESTMGQGSIFRIFFPPSATQEGRTVIRSLTPPKINGRVLIIDDEAPVRRVASDMLHILGMESLTAASGQEGVDLYQQQSPHIDLIILDMKMPGMDGEETFRRLHTLNPHIKVILATGYSEADDLTLFVEQSTVEFLRKPFALSALAEKIQTVLLYDTSNNL